jgi:hypothetical protein
MQDSDGAQFSQGQEAEALNHETDLLSDNLVAQQPELATPVAKISADKISASTSALHARRVVSKAPLVVTEVRRSVRLRGKSAGFKVDACNPAKDCICCLTDPLVLSAKVIWSLGSDFCKIPMKHISDEAL